MPFINTADLDGIIAALEWAGRSPHHPNCKSRRANYDCDCAVGAAQLALPKAKASKAALSSGALREAADSKYGADNIEIDDEPGTSPSDNGVWVAAWVYLANPDCPTCGEPMSPDDTDCEACRPDDCATCAASIETRAAPCDECGAIDE